MKQWYNILFFMVSVLLFPVMLPAALISAKRRTVLRQRLGLSVVIPKTSPPAPDARARPIWIHALSVGEVLSAAPLAQALRQAFPHIPLVFSATTRTGWQIAEARFGQWVEAVFYFPFDFIFSVKHRVQEINPRLMLLVETDIWPNFLYEMQRRNIPTVLVNARLSQRSLNGYRKFAFFTKPLFSVFSRILAQTDADAVRFRCLGITPAQINVIGNLKFDQTAESVSPEQQRQLKLALGVADGERLLLAGSTHEGEEALLAEAFLRLKQEFKHLKLAIIPRKVERSEAIAKQLRRLGLSVCLTSNLDHAAQSAEAVIVAVTGRLKQLYSVCDIAVVGGSLVPRGGHNPLEPAMYAKPVLFGPDMSDFALIAQMLVAAGGACQVKDGPAFGDKVKQLLTDPVAAPRMGSRAVGVFNANKGAVEKTLAVIKSHLIA